MDMIIKTPIFIGLFDDSGHVEFVYETPTAFAIQWLIDRYSSRSLRYRPIRSDNHAQARARREYHETLVALLSSGI